MQSGIMPVDLITWLDACGYGGDNPVGPETEFPAHLCDENGYLLEQIPDEYFSDDFD